MKSEREIRKHLANLRALVKRPCQHDNIMHQLQCTAEREILKLSADMLSWVLEELPEYDHSVEELDAAVKRQFVSMKGNP